MIKTDKTIYDPPAPADGKRILVMRMWPRGVSKDKIDAWLQELGTDKDLIKQWKEGAITWAALRQAYLKSLKGKDKLLQDLADASKEKTLTLLCSCKDEKHCHRHLLKQEIEKRL